MRRSVGVGQRDVVKVYGSTADGIGALQVEGTEVESLENPGRSGWFSVWSSKEAETLRQGWTHALATQCSFQQTSSGLQSHKQASPSPCLGDTDTEQLNSANQESGLFKVHRGSWGRLKSSPGGGDSWLGRAQEHFIGQEGCSPLQERCALHRAKWWE